MTASPLPVAPRQVSYPTLNSQDDIWGDCQDEEANSLSTKVFTRLPTPGSYQRALTYSHTATGHSKADQGLPGCDLSPRPITSSEADLSSFGQSDHSNMGILCKRKNGTLVPPRMASEPTMWLFLQHTMLTC